MIGTAGQWFRLVKDLPASRGGTIHLHYAHLPGLLVLSPWIMNLDARWVITLHSVKLLEDLKHANGPMRKLALRCLSRFELAVCVRQEIADSFGLLDLSGPSILIKPAFLPPTGAEWDPGMLPVDIRRRLEERRAAGTIQLAASAYYLGPGYGREDLYGMESAIEVLASEIQGFGRPVAAYLMVSNPLSPEAMESKRRIDSFAESQANLTVEIHVNEPLVPLLAMVDGFLRPSREDGDSVAVREALALGRPVWASSVVKRPQGCMLFNLDKEEMRRSISEFLRTLADAPPSPPDVAAAPDLEDHRLFASRLTGDAPIP
jgi:hypothetical protein